MCEHVVNAMNVGDVPHSLLARLLKYNIIKKRTADMAAKEGLQVTIALKFYSFRVLGKRRYC